MSPLDLCMAVLSLALLVGVSILFYISLDRRRFRAATSYMFLKHNRSRQAFLSICIGMIADFFANLFSYYGYTEPKDPEQLANHMASAHAAGVKVAQVA